MATTNAPASKTVSYAEWLEMPEVSDMTEEVVNGEIRLMPPVKWKHNSTVEELSWQLRSQLDRKTIDVVTSQFGLIIRRDPLTCRVPDLAVFIRANIVEKDGYIHSPPELVVEVLSRGNTRAEREQKRRDYQSLGVPELWETSPQVQTFEVLQLEAGQLKSVALLSTGKIAPKLFPQAVVEIDTLWQ